MAPVPFSSNQTLTVMSLLPHPPHTAFPPPLALSPLTDTIVNHRQAGIFTKDVPTH